MKIDHVDYVFTNLSELPELQYFLLVYECKYEKGEISLNPEEHDQFEWVTVEELEKKDSVHFVKGWLEYQKNSK